MAKHISLNKSSATKTSAMRSRPMKVFVKYGSKAEKLRNPSFMRAALRPEEIAGGFPPTPDHDLKFRGGHTIAQLSYINFFVGGSSSWMQSDVDSINQALAAAMTEASLNNVMRQYFSNQPISTTFLGSHFVGQKRPKLVTETAAKDLVRKLFQGGQLAGIDFPNTVVCLMLPNGTVLTDGTEPGAAHKREDEKEKPGTPEAEEASSLEGLGGYHGSVDVGSKRLYYAIGVYSQRLAGKENGIVVFDVPWKNVVATFYHELNEARTDPDVDQAIETNATDGVIGWNSDSGEECGDFPVFEAQGEGSLALVFQQISLAQGGSAPIQFQYSNAVHGPEGPISQPHPLQIALEI
jgi:hypothetical protein